MAGRVVFVGALLSCIALAHATAIVYESQKAPWGPCPKFGCKPGEYVAGMFTDSDSADVAYEFKFWKPMTKNSTDYPVEWDMYLENPEYDCWKICKDFKTTSDASVTYWQYEETCEDGGVCTCYDSKVCTDNHFSATPSLDSFTDSTGSYQQPSNFFVGEICNSTGKDDPHFVGADKSRYDFSGVPNENFALISDAHIAVNAFFGGRWDSWMGVENKALTWMRKVAILWGHHSVVFEARDGADASYGKGYLAGIVVDDKRMKLGAEGEKVYLFDGQVEVKWAAARKPADGELVDEYEVRVADIIALRLTLRPEIPLMRTKEDGLVHINVDVISAKLSANVHGVLGQTYRPDFSGRLEKQKLVWSNLMKAYVVPGDNAEGFIDGTYEDYHTSSLLRSDCNFCRFVRAFNLDDETARAIEMATSASSAYNPLGRKGIAANRR